MPSTLLVTGANGAFGQLIVRAALARGHRVVGTVREVSGRNASAADTLRSEGAAIVEMDVTQESSVTAGVDAALDAVGTLDAVVNNAGIGAYGIQEAFQAKAWQQLFDVNVWGVQRVNRAVLPHMRQRQSGVLIHVSSLLGRMVLPFWGAYSASKWALEALAESYRVELSDYGVDSCIVEPGPFPTEFFGGLLTADDPARTIDYGDMAKAAEQSFADFGKALAAIPAQKPQLVADAIVALVEAPSEQRPLRTTVDKMGIGEHVRQHNASHNTMITAIYENLGIGSTR